MSSYMHAPDFGLGPQPVTGREEDHKSKVTKAYFALPVSVFPAHVIPLTRDPLRLCEVQELGYVLGRQGGTSYLLIGPFRAGCRKWHRTAQVFPSTRYRLRRDHRGHRAPALLTGEWHSWPGNPSGVRRPSASLMFDMVHRRRRCGYQGMVRRGFGR